MRNKKPDGPLEELARGFRKRTFVTAKLFARIGTRMARENFGLQEAVDSIDEDDAVRAAELIFSQLDGLKGLGAKIGQMMSYLDQSLPPKAQRVLARLQSQQRGMAYEKIAAVVTAELGKPPEEAFDDFQATPICRGVDRSGPPGPARRPAGGRQGAVPRHRTATPLRSVDDRTLLRHGHLAQSRRRQGARAGDERPLARGVRLRRRGQPRRMVPPAFRRTRQISRSPP